MRSSPKQEEHMYIQSYRPNLRDGSIQRKPFVSGALQDAKMNENIMKEALETISKLRSLSTEVEENESALFHRVMIPETAKSGRSCDKQGTFELDDSYTVDNATLDKFADLRSYVQKRVYPQLDAPFSDHHLVPIGTNKPCAYCELQKRRTKSGWYVYTRFRCEKCGVALCKGQRGCFVKYHQHKTG